MKIKSRHLFLTLPLLAFVILGSQFSTVFAQGTAFTYQGRLNSGVGPANGSYDFQFSLSNAPSGGNKIGNTFTNLGVVVSNGLFTTSLDFGNVFNGNPAWLAISVRTNGAGSFTGLNPLQQLTPVPYAIFANTASNLSGTLPVAQLSGFLANGNLPVSPSFSGTVTAANGFSGNGAGVTNVNAAMLNGVGSGGFWQLGGNNVFAGQFLGSTNKQSLELRAGNQRGLLITTNYSDSPNLVGGSPANLVDAGVRGAVIAGGGTTNYLLAASSNHINLSADFSSIGGGSGNTIQSGADHSLIGGGLYNIIANEFSRHRRRFI